MPRFVNASRWNTSHLVAIYELVASRAEQINHFDWVLVRDICFDTFVSVQMRRAQLLIISFKPTLPEPDLPISAIAKERAVSDSVLGCLVNKLHDALHRKIDTARKNRYHLPSWAAHLSLNYRDITPVPDIERIHGLIESHETIRPDLLNQEDVIELLSLYEWLSEDKFRKEVQAARRWRRTLVARHRRDRDQLAKLLAYVRDGEGELPEPDVTEEDEDDDDELAYTMSSDSEGDEDPVT